MTAEMRVRFNATKRKTNHETKIQAGNHLLDDDGEAFKNSLHREAAAPARLAGTARRGASPIQLHDQ